jgi:glucose-6-phosphate 1-epimerase
MPSPHQTPAELTSNFALPGMLAFDEHNGLARAQITLPTGTATVYLHGAHLTHWQPAGQAPVIWLSELSDFAPGKAIRGGIPVCFPWFATDTGNHAPGGKPGPSHGFARIQEWELAFAALAGEALHLTLTLGANDLSRSYGFDHFRVAVEFIFGSTLTVRISVANTGEAPLVFEEAFHTYFVADPLKSEISGLESATFIDKTDALKQKTGPATPLVLDHWADRVYPGNTATVVIDDRTHGRKITIDKQGSGSTVVWNPHPEASAPLKDLAPDAWQHFLCVETANAGEDRITLAPGEAHVMQAVISSR